MQQKVFYEKLAKLEGAHQESRAASLLSNHSALVDNRSLGDLLVGLREYAKQTKFFNTRNVQDGTWEKLFEHDDALILSTVMSFNGSRVREQFLHRQTYGLGYALREITSLLELYEYWLTIGNRLTDKRARELYLNSKDYVVQNLSVTIQQVVNFFEHEKGKNILSIPQLLKCSKKLGNPIGNIRPLVSNRMTRHEKDAFLLSAVESIVRGLDVLSQNANRMFFELIAIQQRDPSVGMVLAFLRSYQHSQSLSNDFPKKVLAYYQADILKNSLQGGRGDHVYLQCDIQPEAVLKIAKGTEFEAGKNDDLEPLRYEAVNDTYLSGSKVNALQTLFVQRHMDIAPNNVTGSITRVKTVDVMSQSDLADANINVLGYEANANDFGINSDAEIGFYVASPLLLLKEGRREITVELHLRDKGMVQLETVRNRFLALSKNGSVSHIKAALYQLDIADPLFMRQLADKDLNTDLLSIILGFYSCLGIRCIINTAILKSLIEYCCKHISNSLRIAWSRDSEFDHYQLLKDCLLYLYTHAQTVYELGLIHFELISRHLLKSDFLSEEDRNEMKTSIGAQTALTDRDLMKIEDMKRDSDRDSVSCLIHYLHKGFECHLSHEDGWLVHRNYRIKHNSRNKSDAGFTLTLNLENSVKPVIESRPEIHGRQHKTGMPVFILRVNQHAPSCPISWFENFWVEQGKLRVNVAGFRDVVVHNEYGQVDVKKPFFPFSSIPKYDTGFYIGGYEFARKKVDKLSVRVTWKNLPNLYGGFSRYYAGYGRGMKNDDFNVNLTLLTHGSLLPHQLELQQNSPLFQWHSTSGKLTDTSVFKYKFTQMFPTIEDTVSQETYSNLTNVDHGYVCLRLRSSEKAFGHLSYPRLLGDALSFNAKYKRKSKPVPSSPYTPEISRVEVDYSASDDIHFATDFNSLTTVTHSGQQKSQHNSLAFHQWPMGIGLSRSIKGQRLNPLFPVPNESGNLYIGFEKATDRTRLSLYFELSNSTMPSQSVSNTSVVWRYFSATGWKVLNHEDIVSDTTGELSRSGIVTLTYPKDAMIHPGFEPKNQCWLCVSHSEPRHFANIKALSFDAIELKSSNARVTLANDKEGIATSWTPSAEIAGLQGIKQTERSFHSEQSETIHTASIRLVERLRHKNRAITAWDYQRLVLKDFPEVALVKCLPNCKMHNTGIKPGNVLIALMAASSEKSTPPGQEAHIDLTTLNKIQQTLNSVAPPSATINVANATYETIQVRCAVEFYADESLGDHLKKLQRDISAYVSPWSEVGPKATFSWHLRTNDVEAYILGLSYVRRVARVSLVKRSGDNQWPEYFKLDDTAAQTQREDQVDSVCASHPWSLPLPSRHHYIELLQENSQDFKPRPVGINSLEIGSTFVIRGSDAHA